MNPTQWEMIFQNDPLFHLEPRPRAVQFTNQLLDQHLSSVLDLGCGGGVMQFTWQDKACTSLAWTMPPPL